MSRENLSNLLDAMLDESEVRQEADEVRRQEERAAEAQKREAQKLARRLEEEREQTRLQSVDELTGLTEDDLMAVLGAAAPDDLLVVLATADDVLQRRILGSLSEDSVKWLRENLVYMERVTDAERDGARKKILKASNVLLEDGTIKLPEPESIGKDDAPTAPEKELRELLTDLVRIAEKTGTEALGALADSAGEPLLRDGLHLVVGGTSGAALKQKLGALRSELEARYAQRLAWIEQALVAIDEGQSPDDFRASLFD